MKGRYFGPLSRDELFQALIEDKEAHFAKYGIDHFKFVSLNYFPIDKFGQPVAILDENGKKVIGYDRRSYYKSAACSYEAKCFEPRLIRLPRFDF
jgi:hypothetical protein